MTQLKTDTIADHEVSIHITRALQDILAGRVPFEQDAAALTGTVKACIDALTEALQADGVAGARKAFNALVKDHPWLGTCASKSSTDTEQEEKPARSIRFLPTSKFLNQPGQQWLIPEILPRDGLTLVYGESGGYKSFLVMDWSFCLATGTPWLGRSVARGPVAYIAAEGSYGIRKRVNAWLVHHQHFFRSEEELDQQFRVSWYDRSLLLQEPSQVAELLTALSEDFTEPPLLVVIDTLSRCSAGAEESSNTEMARVLASADAIREHLHCTVLIVHHDGKDKERGPRGASALRNNIETAILVTPHTTGNKVECIKAKDAPDFKTIYLDTQEVRFGPQPDDFSLVLVAGAARSDETTKPRMTDTEARMYALLAGKELSYSEWQRRGIEEKLSERLVSQAITSLKKSGLVQQKVQRGPYSIVQEKKQETQEPVETDENH